MTLLGKFASSLPAAGLSNAHVESEEGDEGVDVGERAAMPGRYECHRRQWTNPGDRTTAGDRLAPAELLGLRQQRAVGLRDHSHAVPKQRIDLILKRAHIGEGLAQLDLRAHQG